MYESGPGAPPPERRGVIRFDAIGEAWSLFQAQMGAWIVAGLIALVALSIVVGPYYAYIVAQSIRDASTGRQTELSDLPGSMGSSFLISLLIAAVSALVMGGFVHMAIRQLRGETLAGGDLFRSFSAAGPLVVAGILTMLGRMVGGYLCIIPGLLVGGLWMFTYPIIVDQGLGAIEAMRLSWNTLKSDLWLAMGFYFVVTLVSGLGALLCGFGALFTMPLLPLCIAIAYRDYFPERFGASRQDV